VKSNPRQKSEAFPKLIHTQSALILLEEQFCTTSKSLNFPSALGSSKHVTWSPSESTSYAWNHLYSQQFSRLNAGPGFRSDGTRQGQK